MDRRHISALIVLLATLIPNVAHSGPSSPCIWNGKAAKCLPISFKTGTSTAAGDGATGLGLLNTASGDQSFAGGTLSTAPALRGFSFGDACIADGPNGVATGAASHASGNSSNASNNTTIASGQSSHAEGQSTTAGPGLAAHSEGEGTVASGAWSHAGGKSCTASGDYSFAHGLGCTASGEFSFCQGQSTIASGIESSAFGLSSTATNYTAFATGTNTHATGNGSTSHGNDCTASGGQSLAAGLSSVAAGGTSFAWGTKALTGTNDGTAVFTDYQDYTTTGDTGNQFKMRYENGLKLVKGGGSNNVDGPSMAWKQASVATTDNTPTILQSIPIATNSAALIEWTVVGRRTGGAAGTAGDAGIYTLMKRYKNVAGTVTQHTVILEPGFTAANFVSESEDQATWDAVASTNSPNAILTVTGATDNDVTWHSTAKVIENK